MLRPVIAVIVSSLLLTLGCTERERPPPPPPFDAGPRPDVPRMDAMIVRRDGAAPGMRVDGVLDEEEWDDAERALGDVATDRPGSELGALYAYFDEDTLYVGIELTLAEGDALIGYVDAALGETAGVTDFATLTDDDAALDAALSQDLDVASEFAPELAFGTTAMGRSAVGLDASMGWRRVDADPASFTWIGADEAPFVCSLTACETAVSLSRLVAGAPRTIGFFARIVSATGELTNQTLPEDSATEPARVRDWLELFEDAPPPDAGTPIDAGTDAGSGVRVDGRLDADEWEDVLVLTNSTAAIGIFAGSRLDTLRARRTADELYIAVEGTLGAGHAIILYIDHDLGGGDGLASPTPLADTGGALDRAITKTLFTAAELRLDFAWGTLSFSAGPTTTSDTIGWREIGANPVAYRTVVTPSACGASACEASISLADLGVLGDDDVGIAARLVSATSDAISNQTLPTDVTPEFVTTWLVVSAP